MKSVDLAAIAYEESTGAPVVVLREHAEPHRLVPIIIGSPEANAIAIAVSGETTPRPLTHDLMATLVEMLDGHVQAVEVTEVRDGAFIARLDIQSPAGLRHIDTRPSDAIALAVRTGAPLFVSDEVLEAAGALPPDDEPLEPEAIDAAIEEFRSFLDDVDAADFDPSAELGAAPAEEPDDDNDITEAEIVEDDTGLDTDDER